MRALVTGGAGFVGSAVVDRLLAEGHAVDVIDDLSTGSLANLAEARADRSNEVRFHHVDIRMPEVAGLIARRRPDLVVHLAAGPGDQGPSRDAEVDVVGTVNVLEGARDGGAAKVVMAGAHGPPTARTLARQAAVGYVLAYREVHQLECTVLALATVYGRRQRRGVVAEFIRSAAAGEPCTIHGDGEQTRDFVFVDDVADAFVRATERGSGLVVDIGTGVETSVNRLHQLLASVPPVHTAPPVPEPARTPLDPSRAGMYLGWKAWTSLEEGLRAVSTAP